MYSLLDNTECLFSADNKLCVTQRICWATLNYKSENLFSDSRSEGHCGHLPSYTEDLFSSHLPSQSYSNVLSRWRRLKLLVVEGNESQNTCSFAETELESIQYVWKWGWATNRRIGGSSSLRLLVDRSEHACLYTDINRLLAHSAEQMSVIKCCY